MSVNSGETGDAAPLELIAAAYTARIREFGASHTGVLWGAEASQRARFAEFLHLPGHDAFTRGFTVNDLGCGYGAFFRFLEEAAPGAMRQYHGYDICPDMIAAAGARVTDPRARFRIGGAADTVCDYSFASGTFNLMADAAEDDWVTYVKRCLAALWDKSEHGLVFNMLDGSADIERQPWLYYSDRDDFTDFCVRGLSGYVECLQGPGETSYTLLVRRVA